MVEMILSTMVLCSLKLLTFLRSFSFLIIWASFITFRREGGGQVMHAHQWSQSQLLNRVRRWIILPRPLSGYSSCRHQQFERKNYSGRPHQQVLHCSVTCCSSNQVCLIFSPTHICHCSTTEGVYPSLFIRACLAHLDTGRNGRAMNTRLVATASSYWLGQDDSF